MILIPSIRGASGAFAYLPLKGGGRSAQPTGWGSSRSGNGSDPLPTAELVIGRRFAPTRWRSTSPFQGEVRERTELLA